MRRRAIWGYGVYSVLVGLSISGCVIADQPVSSATIIADEAWVEPDWMTSHREIGEAHQAALAACIEEHGFTPDKGIGGFSVVVRAATIDGSFSEMYAASAECHERYPFPYFGGHEATPELYQRMLDQRSCLIAHGQDIPEPPTEETWLNSGGRWIPFSQLPERIRSSEIGAALSKACPQSGPWWATDHLPFD